MESGFETVETSVVDPELFSPDPDPHLKPDQVNNWQIWSVYHGIALRLSMQFRSIFKILLGTTGMCVIKDDFDQFEVHIYI